LIEADRTLGRCCAALDSCPQKGGMMAVVTQSYRRLGTFVACLAVVAAIVAAIAQASLFALRRRRTVVHGA
jgi:hypothetical protein